MVFARILFALALLFLAVSCGGIGDDLAPSGTDERQAAAPGTTGPSVGQNAPGFTLSDTLGNPVDLAAALEGASGAVLYFTMWCPVCDGHMSHIRSNVAGDFPGVRFFAVDYVSGSVAGAREAEVSSGYANSVFTVLADVDGSIRRGYDATMGTTVVIDAAGVIKLNEDYKDGSRLRTVLDALQ